MLNLLGSHDTERVLTRHGAMPWQEERWDPAILTHIRELGRLRSQIPALRRGEQSVRALDADTVLIVREPPGEPTAVVVHRGSGVSVDRRSLGVGGPDARWADELGGQDGRGPWKIEGPGSLILTPDGGNGQ